MANQQKEKSGILFKNDRKESDTHADYNGSCTIEGREYWMNAWIKEGQRGKFMSFSFKPKQNEVQRAVSQPPARTQKPAYTGPGNLPEDDIPF